MIVLASVLLYNLPTAIAEENVGAQRVSDGLVLVYDFENIQGGTIPDRSGRAEPLPLKMSEASNIVAANGALVFRSPGILQSGSARQIVPSLERSSQLTIEAWVEPESSEQTGPARIFTFSKNGSERNFTIGQDGGEFDVRLRTDKTSKNGIPSLQTKAGAAKPQMTHVVYSRNRAGKAQIFIDGKLNQKGTVPGKLSNWNPGYRIAIGNELSGDRPWRGAVHLVALYRRALTADEVLQNFQAGPHAVVESPAAEPKRSENEELFERRIAYLLADRCLECHDTSTFEGELDLSRRDMAFSGESGTVIIPGRPDESLLFELVEMDDMPKDRDPLTGEEKRQLRKWIAGGAAWTIDRIDPVVYVHEGSLSESWIRRLTVSEYIETVTATFGIDIAEQAKQLLPPDVRADGFRNTAYNLNVDLKHIEAYARLAEMIVQQLDLSEFTQRFMERPKFTDKEMGRLISAMGKWVLRGPLSEDEIIDYRGISTAVAGSGGTYEEAVGRILQAMLQSPRFVYRIEEQRGDGATWPVRGFDLANRLSYTLWGASPDKELARAADKGELETFEQIERQVDRMLQDPRVVDQSLRFVDQWLHLSRLDYLQPSADRFPGWDRALAQDMQVETRAFFQEIIWNQKRPVADLLNARVTFLTRRLAKHYGLSAKVHLDSTLPDDALQRVDLPRSSARGGLLTHGSVLTIGGDDASMVARGLFVFHHLLRGVVKDPPPCVDTTPVETEPGRTQRAIAQSRIENHACRGCHSKFEPLAFGLEKFDGLGTYRETDRHGNRLREDGTILVPGSRAPIEYENVRQYMDLLAGSQRVRESIAWKVAQFSLGRPIRPADVPILDKIQSAAEKTGGTYPGLLRAIVLSDLVLTTQTEPNEAN